MQLSFLFNWAIYKIKFVPFISFIVAVLSNNNNILEFSYYSLRKK